MHTVNLTVKDCDRHPADQCISCITRRLDSLPGITDYSFSQHDNQLKIKVTYDSRILPLSEIARQLHCTHAVIDPDIAHMVLRIQGMHSPRCERIIESTINHIPNSAVHATASYPSASLRLEFDRLACPLPEIIRRLDILGYTPIFSPAQPLPRKQPLTTQTKPTKPLLFKRLTRALAWIRVHPEVILLIIAAISLATGFIVHLLSGPLHLRILCLIIAAIASSTRTMPQAIHSLRQFKLDVDVLMFVAAAGAASLGHFEEGAFLLFLFGLGAAGEHLALDHARSAINAIANVAPDTANLIDQSGQVTSVPISNLKIGDHLSVQPFQRIPADALITQGSSYIDQATITGESQPVPKTVGNEVFAGTFNTDSALTLEVTRPASDSTIARILKLVEEAQTTKSKTQLFTDRIEEIYVPIVFFLTLLLIFIPPLATQGNWGVWFIRAMAFLTAASPCALAIGTPAAILCTIARAARLGVLVKGGIHLEQLASIRSIAFDKTGTLTTSASTIYDIQPASPDISKSDLLTIAASVEQSITHPLARAITAAAEDKHLMLKPVSNVTQKAGQGVSAKILSDTYTVGKPSPDSIIPDALTHAARDFATQGKTVIYITKNYTQTLGFITLADQIRPNAAPVISALRSQKINNISILTGDHALAAQSLNSLGVDDIYADLLPEDKLNLIDDLLNKHSRVAMVGDGINDTPALAHASVGIAMGAAGSDAALETADIVLMGSDLSRLPDALSLARKSKTIIIQNLTFALAVIIIVSPLAALGFADLALAVFLHEGSTVLVTLNALRLLRYKSTASDYIISSDTPADLHSTPTTQSPDTPHQTSA